MHSAAAESVGRGSPPPKSASSSTPETVLVSSPRTLCARGWMVPTYSMPAKARVSPSPREGQRFPEGRDAFHHQELIALTITRYADPSVSPLRRGPTHVGLALQAEDTSAFLSTPRA